MELSGKKIVLISSGQPSLNPRLVKEADALSDAGCEVTVLYAYWNEWGTRHDSELLKEKKWKAVRLGGDPQENSATWFLSRLNFKLSRYFLEKTGNFKRFADTAIARSSYFLIKGAKKYEADIYIAHNLGALPATVKTAQLHKKSCGFDAEDFHRNEVSDDNNSFHYKICKYIEDRYLPRVGYITSSSPLIAEKYATLYSREITTLLNVFPKTNNQAENTNENGPLKLFWFSQTIGPNRGLETIIQAIGISGTKVQLHLLGQPSDRFEKYLYEIAVAAGVNKDDITFHQPVKGDFIFNMAAHFDIGLASETGFSSNNNMALSNKLFTYIQSGLAVAVSNTPAQSAFVGKYPQTGRVYRNALELSRILIEYDKDRALLRDTKKQSLAIGQTQLNWENESKLFLKVVEKALTETG